ncbi:MAG: pyruvate kinase [Nitrospira sp.]|nr:pyruvate kinase [Nitrospira sp.]HRA98211.1 pyruvate kinase [Nitrospira sp.]
MTSKRRSAIEPPKSPLARRLEMLYSEILDRVGMADSDFRSCNPDSACSRDNLLAYLALRDQDVQDLQFELADRGLSSLGRLEGSVMASLQHVMGYVGAMPPETTLSLPDLNRASSLLAQRSRALLGRPRAARRTRIMVTLDATIIHQADLLDRLLLEGMDIARINCAHDTELEWEQIIKSIRSAEDRLTQGERSVGRRCRILMDLAGPKVRTGSLEYETRPLKLAVPKDAAGRPSRLLEGHLDSAARYTEWVQRPGKSLQFVIAIQAPGNLDGLRVGEPLQFKDARNRPRTLYVLERISPTHIRVGLERTAYLQEGILLRGEEGLNFTVGPVAPQPVDLRVQARDRLHLYRNPEQPGHLARDGMPAGISCTLPEALLSVKTGDRVYIDDGKIAASVVAVHEQYVALEITAPCGIPARIKSDKGLNFPDSSLNLPALTARDRKDLPFVVAQANAVGLSFVHRPEDVYDLRDALKKLGVPDMGIVLKVETQEAVHHLAQLLVAGLELPSVGVMIARGDLAVEVGFERLARVQEDILCLCEAAHIPVIWATQVLETLAKSGLPARAEITDAAMGHRAECVMLNKGEHVLDAVKTLAHLLQAEEPHHVKKREVFREITPQFGIFTDPSAQSS